ncbi:MAG TPA: hypothetical protein PL158_09320 [Bacillota bacterium]|nr:hypothetical protein [Bacillota bacterium]HOL09980.1 hypothetical protein [Bacillota bacterium]
MLTSNHKSIHAMILEHIARIHDEIIIHDPEFRRLSERPVELLNRIREKLAPEDRHLLDEYDEEWILPINRQDEIIYTQALIRGIVPGYWVTLVGNGLQEIKV